MEREDVIRRACIIGEDVGFQILIREDDDEATELLNMFNEFADTVRKRGISMEFFTSEALNGFRFMAEDGVKFAMGVPQGNEDDEIG